MYERSVGIVLQLTPYSDAQKVVRIFTRDFGTRSFMVTVHGKSRGSRAASALFRPMQELNLVFKNLPSDKLGRIKEASPQSLFNNLHNDPGKRIIALFLSELLYKVLKNHQTDESLYDFILSSLLSLDETNLKTSDFHLFFLAGLASMLGFHPENNYNEQWKYFNTQEGRFVSENFTGTGVVRNETLSQKLNIIFNPDENSASQLHLNRDQRVAILNVLIEYFRYHVPEFSEIKSLEVLREIV
jgi:DNA repair protein RecO (recombination protein O)